MGALLLFTRRDMLHLDADALHDRLHHWTLTRLEPAISGLMATLSFRHARPADPHAKSDLDLQEGWLDMEPTLRLDPPLLPARVDRALDLVPELLTLVEKHERPSGWRRIDEGNVE